MKNLLRILLAAFLAVPMLSGCSKDETIDFNQLIGTWKNKSNKISYSSLGVANNQTFEAFDLTYTFKEDKTFKQENGNISGTYSYSESAKTLTLTPSGAASFTLQVVSLTATSLTVQLASKDPAELIGYLKKAGVTLDGIEGLELLGGVEGLLTDLKLTIEFIK